MCTHTLIQIDFQALAWIVAIPFDHLKMGKIKIKSQKMNSYLKWAIKQVHKHTLALIFYRIVSNQALNFGVSLSICVRLFPFAYQYKFILCLNAL